MTLLEAGAARRNCPRLSRNPCALSLSRVQIVASLKLPAADCQFGGAGLWAGGRVGVWPLVMAHPASESTQPSLRVIVESYAVGWAAGAAS
jgi:hypothetical protein